jgi:hypothetical protein
VQDAKVCTLAGSLSQRLKVRRRSLLLSSSDDESVRTKSPTDRRPECGSSARHPLAISVCTTRHAVGRLTPALIAAAAILGGTTALPTASSIARAFFRLLNEPPFSLFVFRFMYSAFEVLFVCMADDLLLLETTDNPRVNNDRPTVESSSTSKSARLAELPGLSRLRLQMST